MPAAAGAADALVGRRPPGDDPFYVGFTSGTAGAPKAFARDHASWLQSFAGSAEVFGIAGDDVVLAPGPLSHSHFLYAAVQALHAGATVLAPGRFDPSGVARALAAAATRLVVVPTMLAELVRRPLPAPALTSVICAGAKLAPELAGEVRRALPDAELVEFYGASELSFVSVRRHGDGCPPTSVGRAFPGVEVRVVEGEIQVRSALVFAGYLDGDADGAARLLADGWATVGDHGRLDADGCLHVVGRAGSMLIVGGVNVYPEPIEELLARHPDVAEAAVVGLPSARWGVVPVAAVVPAAPALDVAALRRHAAAALPRIARPRRYVVVDALPRTRSGKLAREALRDLLLVDP